MKKLSIDIISDIVCPWCFIGARRLSQALEKNPDIEATIHHRPFLLDASIPPEGLDLRKRLRERYNTDPERMFGQVESAARESGIPLDFSKVRRWVSTLRGHTLIRLAGEKGLDGAVAQDLFTAYFLDGKDVSEMPVLLSIASKHGLDEAHVQTILTDGAELSATRDEALSASKAGVRGVPFFVLDNRLALSGAQPVEVFEKALRQATA